jgi:hypothetical protein
VNRTLLSVALVAGSVALAGCGRRAPGPDECHEFALRLSGGERHAFRSSLEYAIRGADPTEDAVLERTTECITTPYDRELLACVENGGRPSACFRMFEARQAARSRG